jgi:hypothetical protein
MQKNQHILLSQQQIFGGKKALYSTENEETTTTPINNRAHRQNGDYKKLQNNVHCIVPFM